MSQQLAASAALSLIALAATALLVSGGATQNGDARDATAHGSIVSVLLRA